ncbi:NUDIX domain-containing protein [Bacteroides sp. 51]|uniref:NUDIX hydrolase n=1 Tax=Bacteroides sp. 51 TaxID=2302938 RepID=UPI0013D4CF79|nr:NUDIX domain-containing protein [Bacteroides sp. 51]NDV83284.1 NUDIX domain-containing protein [Bacteroides sp. 51]
MSTDNSYNKKVLSIDASQMLPGVSIDCVIFGFHEGVLKILLNKFDTHNQWMLPGGFVGIREDVDAAAYRILKERTGLHKTNLIQFHLFGDCNRTNIEENRRMLAENNFEGDSAHWFAQRFVSAGYYAFVDFSKVKIKDKPEDRTHWHMLNEIPDLYSDHNKIIKKAIDVIRLHLGYIPIGFHLLPDKFTMSELRVIYETILGETLDRRNFQRKMLASELVVPLDEVSKKWGVKSAALFTFNKERYEKLLKSGSPLLGSSKI